MTRQPRALSTALPLFLVILIDAMGLGLLYPILSSLIIDPSTHFLQMSLPGTLRHILYGITISVFMLSWFFGAAILGDLSDMIGRKKSLLICLGGSFFGYLLSAVAIPLHSLSLLISGRMIAGFTAGSQPIAQAAIIDISNKNNKARNISLILLAGSVGFILGPVFGGLLSDNKLLSWLSFSTPLYFAASVSLISAILLAFFFKETHRTKRRQAIKLHYAIIIFLSGFKHPAIKRLCFCFLFMMLGWSCYFSFISLFVLERFHFSSSHVSYFLMVMAIGFAIGCYSIGPLLKIFRKITLIIAGLFLASAMSLLMILNYYMPLAWVINLFIGIFIAISYSLMLTRFSDGISADKQGWIMGITGSIMALASSVASLLTGFTSNFGADFPIGSAAAGLCLAAILVCLTQRQSISAR